MMPVLIPEYLYVLMFLLIVLIVQFLKRRGIFNDTHQPVFDRIVIEAMFAAPRAATAAAAGIPHGYPSFE